jgi:hypothetical protein
MLHKRNLNEALRQTIALKIIKRVSGSSVETREDCLEDGGDMCLRNIG